MILYKCCEHCKDDIPHITKDTHTVDCSICIDERYVKPRLKAAYHAGFVSGKSKAMRHMSDEPHLSLDEDNPYE